ncbi:uncharacterized protein LOC131012495 [Salvia miltiorrhiza]|uniref:uncharacterized protein LOC131012495 n=1 Tax=Salvia miltiorrhiza TaxID=226208 RepID=UPI0025ACEF15|nr:uncharacterized protein LOC131012495 [Salvia miltiorrhiza]
MYGLNRLKSANLSPARFAAAAAAPYAKRLLRSSRHSLAATPGIDNFASIGEAGKISDRRNNYERKMLPPALSRIVATLTCESSADGGFCDVYLVGADKHAESRREVQAVIQSLKPQVVFLGLCASRDYVLTCQKVEVPTIREMVDMLKKKQNPFWRLYKWYLVRNDSQCEASDVYREAYEEALEYGGKVVLGDRPREISFQRYWAKTSLWELYAFHFINLTVRLPEELFDKAKDDGEIDNLIIQTMNKKYPVITETFFHESDRYMSTKLLEVARKHNIVVAVVGKYPIRNPEALERTYRDEATS